MLSSLFVAVSCVSGSAATQCAECERLEAEFLEARDRMRTLTRLRRLNAVEEKAHVNDLHATILHLMGLDHKRLTFLHNGRDERLTDVGGRVINKLLV